MKLAIVGSALLRDHPEAWRLIRAAFDRYQPTVLVSGGAIGIDAMAEQEAKARGIACQIFRPTVYRWEGRGGFRARNLEIAHCCDRLIRIATRRSKTYGSGWTRDRAADLGKPTEEFLLD